MDVAAAVEELGRQTQGLVTSARLVAAGVSRQQLSRARAAGQVVQVHRGVYALVPLPPRPRFLVTADGVDPAYVAHVRARLLNLGPGAAACGRTAAALYGWGLLVEPAAIELCMRHGSDLRRKGVQARQRRSAARSWVRVLEDTWRLPLTTPVQTVLDCALDLPLLQAVVVCDSALRAGSVTQEELLIAAGRLPGVKGAARVRRVLELGDPRSESVLESLLRTHLLLAGISAFTTQAVLARLPRSLRVDFCFAEAGLVIEVDGARWHPDPARDLERDNQLAVLGWRVLRLGWSQVVNDSTETLADIRAALDATPTVHLAARQAPRAA